MRASTESFTRAKRMRREMTPPEVILWQQLRGGRLDGHRFRRQHPVGPYIIDFCCADKKLAIEVDGELHGDAAQITHDEQRTMWLNNQGIRVVRFTANDILNDTALEGVMLRVEELLAPSASFAGPPPRGGG